MMTLPQELKVAVPTVGGIHMVAFKEVTTLQITSTVMAHNLDWPILTLDKSSTVAVIMCGPLGGMGIFPTRVSLTTITLHYYSDSDLGFPRLRFYAVPDDFNVWDAPTTGTPHVDVAAVPPGGEPAGRRNVSINVNFSTKKVLMYKFSSSFQFAASEVKFFKCKQFSIAVAFMVKKQCLCR